jgi:hypothetical protein
MCQSSNDDIIWYMFKLSVMLVLLLLLMLVLVLLLHY